MVFTRIARAIRWFKQAPKRRKDVKRPLVRVKKVLMTRNNRPEAPEVLAERQKDLRHDKYLHSCARVERRLRWFVAGEGPYPYAAKGYRP